MASTKPQPGFVCERFESSRPTRVDREKGVVEGIRVLNAVSRNGRVYPEQVLRAHLDLYKNLPVNVGHHFDFATMTPQPVPPADRFGVLGPTPRVDAGGVTSDLHFNPEHAFAKPFLWACENSPGLYSFSPLHRVRWSPKRDAQGRLVAESVLEAASADIVSDGGTTSTIFESRTWVGEAMAEMPVAADIVSALETDGQVIALMTDIMNELKSKVSEQSTRDTIVSLVTAAMSGAPPEPPADEADLAAAAPALEYLRRSGGRLGKWAAEYLDRAILARSLARKQKWAGELIKAELVPEHLVTPVFVSTVAESYGNEPRARELIADRKALSAGAGGGTGGKAVSSDRAGAKSVKQLVEEATWGNG